MGRSWQLNGYIPNDDICYAVFEALSLQKPILIEGDPGVGKTSLAIAVSKMLSLPFLRLQMYDGLTKDEILYDYDYQRQLLTLEAVKPKINEEIKGMDVNAAIRKVAGDVNFYGEEFLIPRPVLQTINGTGKKLLLIDEIDKSSEETEYMLYECPFAARRIFVSAPVYIDLIPSGSVISVAPGSISTRTAPMVHMPLVNGFFSANMEYAKALSLILTTLLLLTISTDLQPSKAKLSIKMTSCRSITSS